MLTPEEVFITDGFPEHTYVPLEEGAKEHELREGLGQRNKVISISGPSKSGKTTLCDEVFGKGKGSDRMYVTGDSISKPDDLWHEAYRQVTDDTDRQYYDCSQGERIERLITAELPLVIDDFHYMSREVQGQISRQIKNAASEGLRIVCLSVPHRGDDPVRSNPDLSGRFFSVTFEYWEDADLAKIAERGFPKVGFKNQSDFNGLLAREALRSPQIMQTLCLEACRTSGLDLPLEQVDPGCLSVELIKQRTLRSYNNQTILDLLRQGPPTRGTERIEYKIKGDRQLDVYECLIEALRRDPPFLQLGLDEIRQRINEFLADTREPNVRSAMQQYETIFKDTKAPLDWDDEKRRLTVIDPHFYFFLRNTK